MGNAAETPYRREVGYAERYRDRRFHGGSGPRTHRREVAGLRRLLAAANVAATPSGPWLDAPAGAGRLSPLLPGTVVQLDRDPAMLVAARHGTATDAVALRTCASVHRLPFVDAAFDGVLCMRLLQHIPAAAERIRILTELARVSRRTVLLSYFEAASLPHVRRWLRRRTGKPRSGRCAVRWAQLQTELHAAGLHPLRRLPLRPFGLSEQTLVLCRKLSRE